MLAFICVVLTWPYSLSETLNIPTPYGELAIDPFGDDSLRIRIAPPGNSIVNPQIQALLLKPPPILLSTVLNSFSIKNGNIAASVDSNTGFVTISRVSDGSVLLRQIGVSFKPAPLGSKLGAVSATILFSGLAPNERLHGLGEHRDGHVARTSFSNSWKSNSNGILTIAMAVSDLGYGFLWNSAGYGSANLNTTSQEWTVDSALNIDFWVCTSSSNSSNKMADVLKRYGSC